MSGPFCILRLRRHSFSSKQDTALRERARKKEFHSFMPQAAHNPPPYGELDYGTINSSSQIVIGVCSPAGLAPVTRGTR